MRAVSWVGTRLIRADRGTAAVEFAIALPVLILLFTGGFQLNDAVSAYRKVTTTSRTLADLTTQYPSVNNSDIATILNASQEVLSPYSTSDATMVIAQVKTDMTLQSKVDWSDAKNGTALTPGAAYNLPLAIRQPGTAVIVATVSYKYKPLFGSSYIGTIPFQETIIMSPRVSDQVIRK